MSAPQQLHAERAHPNRTLGILVLGAIAYALAQTMIIPALPAIQHDVGASPEAATWLLTAFLLTSSVSTPLLGRLGDMYGKEKVLLAVLGVFALGSFVSAIGGSIGVLILGRPQTHRAVHGRCGLQISHTIASNLRIDGERMHADFMQLSEIGATPEGGINRVALSPEDLTARAWFADRIDEAGLVVRDDDAGNLSGVLTSRHPNAKTLLIGSHLDSVPNGGRYDGAIGVLAALECLRTLRDAEIELPVNLEAINFTDDEGNWRSLFGCRALAGALTTDDLTDQRVDNGPFRAAMARAGIDPRAIFRARRSPATLAGYLELHIEQSARLHRAGINIGVVTGIVGRTTYLLTFNGQAGHSGTTDMYHRRDALRGAALFVVRGHDTVRQRYGDGIFNVGDIEVEPGAFNVIPSRARLLMECRHVSEKHLSEMETTLLGIARECAAANGLEMESQHIVHVPAATMAAGVIQAIEQSANALGLSHMPLFSYSGHSAQILSKIMPSGMIFIPSVNGIGHHPDEFTEWSDVVNGANVLLQTILSVANV